MSGHLRLVVDNEPAERDWADTIDDYKVWLERWAWARGGRKHAGEQMREATDRMQQMVATQIMQLRARCGLPQRPSPAVKAVAAQVSG